MRGGKNSWLQFRSVMRAWITSYRGITGLQGNPPAGPLWISTRYSFYRNTLRQLRALPESGECAPPGDTVGRLEAVMKAYDELLAKVNAAQPAVERLLSNAATPASITRHGFLDALEARARKHAEEVEGLTQLTIAQLQAALAAANHEIGGLQAASVAFEAANGLAAKRTDAAQLRNQLRNADIQLQNARAALGDAVRAALVGSELSIEQVLATQPIFTRVSDVETMSQSKRAMSILLGTREAEITTLEAEEADLLEQLSAAEESRAQIVERLQALGVNMDA